MRAIGGALAWTVTLAACLYAMHRDWDFAAVMVFFFGLCFSWEMSCE